MAELAPLQLFDQASATTEVFNVTRQFGSNQSEDFVLVEFEDGYMYRVRFATIKGTLFGSVGTATLTLWISVSGLANLPWTNFTNASAVVAPAGQTLNVNDEYTATWATEIGTGRAGVDTNWGKAIASPFPLVWIPGSTSLHLDVTISAGSDITPNIFDGFVQVERFVQGSAEAPEKLATYSPLYSYDNPALG